MEKVTKNKFLTRIFWSSIINLVSIGGMVPSIYFFSAEYSNYFANSDNTFWVGYALIVAMIISIAIFITSFSILWKLSYDYLWRKKRDKVGE